MNSRLEKLQLYPFQKLATLLGDTEPNLDYPPINLSIGEPKMPAPKFIEKELSKNSAAIRAYPTTVGGKDLRVAISQWIERRYEGVTIDPNNQVLPVLGSREALFGIAQVVIDNRKDNSTVIVPNPFYQIYEGGAILAGAQVKFLNLTKANNYELILSDIPEETWAKVQLMYVCSPNNPTGKVLSLEKWKEIFEYSREFGFIVAADECYSEIFTSDNYPPLGSLEAAAKLGQGNFTNLVTFGSLSKRSNIPGLRSGFVAGDADVLKKFLTYRTYHGSAMSPTTQKVSIAAWGDEDHVIANRNLYSQNFNEVGRILPAEGFYEKPDAGFYIWMETPTCAIDFAKCLYKNYNLTVLPGPFLARSNAGVNPGSNRIRVALVEATSICRDATHRIYDQITK